MAQNSTDFSITHPVELGAGPKQLIVIGSAFLAVTWLAVLLRVWSRAVITKYFGWDDWMMLVTMASFTCQCAYVMRLGVMEKGSPAATFNSISSLVTDVMAFTASYVMSTLFLKVSLALFFLRIIIRPWERNIIIYSLVVYTLYTLAYFGVAVFGCGNPAKFFKHVLERKCVSIKHIVIPMSYAHTSLNALMDWIFVVLPIRTLWHLKMPMSTKCWASGLILLGALGSVASLIRLKTVPGIEPELGFFKASTPTMIWSTIEPGLGIAAASFATLRPMFRRCIETTRSGYSRDHSDARRATSGHRDFPSQGLSLSARPQVGRTAFRSFNSGDSDVELNHVTVRHDPEKGHETLDFNGQLITDRTAEGIWVQHTVAVGGS